MRKLRLVAVLTLVASATAPAVSAEIVRDGSSISITGRIDQQDYVAFLRTATPETTTVYLDSPGGVLPAAIAIGRLVRAHKLETIVPENAICASGCALVWFAGVKRRLDGRLGLHSAWTKGQSAVASEAGNSQMAAYLREVGVSELLARLPARVEPSDMWWFDGIGIAELGVATEPPQIVAKKGVHQFPPAPQAEVDRRDIEMISRWTFEERERWDAFWKSLGRALGGSSSDMR